MKTPVTAQPQQEEVVNKLKNQRGVLAYHTLGSGKTLTSIFAAEQYGGATVVTPASLQDNYKKELLKAKAKGKYDIMSYEKFTSEPRDLSHKVLVLDEAHRIRTSDSKRSKLIRRAATSADKVILLTGTPIQNAPHEIAPLINTVAGKNVLPLSEKDFNYRYINKVPVYPSLIDSWVRGVKPSYKLEAKNLDDFKARTKPFVSYYSPKKSSGDFPIVSEKAQVVPMDPAQTALYNSIEKTLDPSVRYKLQNILPPSKAESSNLNAFLSASRQLSNSASAFTTEKIAPSPKIKTISSFIQHTPERQIVYSNYLDSGLMPLAQDLEKHKVNYGLFTGQLSKKEKNELVKNYNSGKIKTLLLSSSGGEGLDLKKTRFVHIMEPHWNDPKIDQVIGRAARYKSHEGLPQDQQKVEVRKYIADLPNEQPSLLGKLFGAKSKNRVTADEYLLRLSADKKRLNDSFLDQLKN